MIALRIASPPKLVKVARHRSGGADDHIARPGKLVHRADDLGLRRQRCMPEAVQTRDLPVPFRTQLLAPPTVRSVHRPALEPIVEGIQRRACVTGQRDAAELVAVELGDVDVHEPHPQALKCGARRSREVAVARADADYDVGLGSNPVCGQRASRADPAQRAGRVEWD